MITDTSMDKVLRLLLKCSSEQKTQYQSIPLNDIFLCRSSIPLNASSYRKTHMITDTSMDKRQMLICQSSPGDDQNLSHASLSNLNEKPLTQTSVRVIRRAGPAAAQHRW